MGRTAAAEASSFSDRLIAWARTHGRHDLPWQRDANPYRVWVSEIMLQQTQVATVIPYFERFVARFPSVATLAAAELDDVLALWSGLGYYARGRNLHRAARRIVAEHGGELPEDPPALEALPGIGRSTAAAILALARGQRLAILDGNVKRVLARYHAIRAWPGERAATRGLWAHAEAHTPMHDVTAYTQAIMDLGATVCTRRNPRCTVCPVADACAALANGLVDTLPAPRPKRARAQRRTKVLLVRDGARRILLERRPEWGIWGGLLSLPELPVGEHESDWCRQRLGADVASTSARPPVAHSFTHFDLELLPVAVELAGPPCAIMDTTRWLWCDPVATLPGGIAAPIAKILSAERPFSLSRTEPRA